MQAQLDQRLLAASRRASEMPRSGIRRIYNAARELEARGIDVIRLDIGDPDFDLPQRITAATHAAMLAGQTHYSPMIGLPEARAAIAAHMARKFGPVARAFLPGKAGGQECPPRQELLDHIVVNQGATQGLNSALLLACGEGDSILLPEVYWPNYIQQAVLGNIEPRFYRLGEGFQPVLADLARLTDATTRAVLVNSPSNPTGALFPQETVRALYEFARERGLWLISDEAYCDFVYEGEHVSPLALDWELPPEQRRVLAVYSFSKSYAATGLRLGWTISPRLEITTTLATMNEPLTGSLTTPLQFGLAAGLAEEDTEQRRESLCVRWELAGKILAKSGLAFDPPSGGLFYFVDVSATGLDGEAFASKLLEQQRVSVVPGSSFGLQPQVASDGTTSYVSAERAARCVRLCFALPEPRLREGLGRIVDFIRSLR